MTARLPKPKKPSSPSELKNDMTNAAAPSTRQETMEIRPMAWWTRTRLHRMVLENWKGPTSRARPAKVMWA